MSSQYQIWIFLKLNDWNVNVLRIKGFEENIDKVISFAKEANEKVENVLKLTLIVRIVSKLTLTNFCSSRLFYFQMSLKTPVETQVRELFGHIKAVSNIKM